jgi:hypothetical protein
MNQPNKPNKPKEPNKPNKPNEPNEPKSKEEVFKKAFEDMCKGLDRFGPKEILNLMVIHSHRDDIVHHLLVQFPTVVALGDFLPRQQKATGFARG